MTADHFRQLFEYHIKYNHLSWDFSISALTDDQYQRDLGYSHGSLHNQCVHLMSVDQRWFSGLRGKPLPDWLDPAAYPDRPAVRAAWDSIEAKQHDYLATLTDVDQPMNELKVWQVLFQVFNHGTDHLSPILSMLAQLGAPTFPQDYVFTSGAST